MSYLVWKLHKDKLATDEKLKKKGIQLASKCHCCKEQEDNKHIFFTSPIAQQVWHYVGSIQGYRQHKPSNLKQAIIEGNTQHSTQGHINNIIPITRLWVLWEARNKAKHNGQKITFESCRSRIMQLISAISTANLTKAKYWKGMETLATTLGIHIEKKQRKRVQVLEWIKPNPGTLKLNIDAAHKDRKTGYGGVLRDDKGKLIWAVGIQGEANTALEAEIEAARQLLEWFVTKGYRSMLIETDSLILTQQLEKNLTQWMHVNKLEQIQQLIVKSSSKIMHVYREKNQAADMVAGIAMKSADNFQWTEKEAPNRLKAILQLESESIPYLRRSRQ